MYSRKIIYFMVGVLLICGLVVMIGEMGKNLEADETELSENSSYVNKGNLLVGRREEELYICDALKITESKEDDALSIDLEERLTQDSFLSELGEVLGELMGNEPSSFLYGMKGCYLSSKGIYKFNLVDYRVTNSIFCFIFTEDGEYAGELIFYECNEQLEYNIMIRDKDNDIYSDILCTLAEAPNERFIFLTNGYRYTTLNVNNELGKLVGSVVFEVKGDCYGKLNSERLAVSYEEIMDKNNWGWIDFE